MWNYQCALEPNGCVNHLRNQKVVSSNPPVIEEAWTAVVKEEQRHFAHTSFNCKLPVLYIISGAWPQ